uniref:Uncharacterized protein n=1 Tax=Rangifer tarandus platyrhynchus TaxID=3082113 RepID=A0ACB0E8N1_RANTA|nr:unnamed protein product [Rangifer tarandus platyrhynchus]
MNTPWMEAHKQLTGSKLRPAKRLVSPWLWGPLDRNHRRMHHVSWKLQPLQEERLPPGRVHGPRPSATCPPPHTFEPSPPHLAPRGPALSAELAPSSKNSPRPRVHRRLWLKGSMYQVKRKPL